MDINLDKFCDRNQAAIRSISLYDQNKGYFEIGTDALVTKPKLVLHNEGHIEKMVLEIREGSWYRMKRSGKPLHKSVQFNQIHDVSGVEFQTNRNRYYFDLVGKPHSDVRYRPNGNMIFTIWGDIPNQRSEVIDQSCH